ncbi:MAG: hypothetical protein EOO24_25040, partial [Comamonadaceae bacterium]
TAADIAAGRVSITTGALAGGDHAFTARVVDAAGNASAQAAALQVAVDPWAPVLSAANVDGDQLVLSYGEQGVGLDAAGPAAGQFSVSSNGAAVAVTAVRYEPAARTVTLTLAGAVGGGDAVLVSYVPGATAFGDVAGNRAAAFTGVQAANLTGLPTPPEQVRVVTDTVVAPPAPTQVVVTTPAAAPGASTLPGLSSQDPPSPVLGSTPFVLPSYTPLNGLGGVPGDYATSSLNPVVPLRVAQLGDSPEILESLDRGFPALRGTEFGNAGSVTVPGTSSDGAVLSVLNGIPTLAAVSGGLNYAVPRDAFVHTDARAIIQLEARQVDGQPLPAWLGFDGVTGLFNGQPATGGMPDLQLEVIARDNAGRLASTTFTVLGDPGRSAFDLASSDRGFPAVRMTASELATLGLGGSGDVLVRFRPIADFGLAAGRGLAFSVPADAFAHTDPRAVIRLQATREDGSPLPPWMQFDSVTGRLGGVPPPDFEGDLEIRVTARDNQGHEATNRFKLTVGKGAVAQRQVDPAGARTSADDDADEKARIKARSGDAGADGEGRDAEAAGQPAQDARDGKSGKDKAKVKRAAASFADQIKQVREQGPAKESQSLLAKALAAKGTDKPAGKRL